MGSIFGTGDATPPSVAEAWGGDKREMHPMELDLTGLGCGSDDGDDSSGVLPGIVEMLVQQVRSYENEHGVVEPLDPKDPATGGRALSGIVEERIAAIKGVLIAMGDSNRQSTHP